MGAPMVSAPENEVTLLLKDALDHHRAGRFSEAERTYLSCIGIDAGNAQALTLLGTLKAQTGHLEDAVRLLSQSLQHEPRQPFALNSLGNALHALNRQAEAIARYDEAIALKPDHAAAHSNRGNALRALYRAGEALASYEQALRIDPNYVDAHVGRADLWRELGRYDDSIGGYDRALRLSPDSAETHYKRGVALQQIGRMQDALASYDRAIALKHAFAEAHNNRGNTLIALRRSPEAVRSYQTAIALRPGYAQAHNNLANALEQLGRYEEALASIETTLALDPEFPYAAGLRYALKMQTCEWSGITEARDALHAALVAGSPACTPFSLLTLECTPDLRQSCAEIYVRERYLRREFGEFKRSSSAGSDRIRVAYLSSDFHAHATAYLMAGVFEHHDRDRFDVHAVSFGPSDGSVMRHRLEMAFEHFHDVQDRDDREVAGLLRELGIEIAVDLKGFTRGCRPGILARRPAPVQVNYLGYPGTMGADYIDYVLADSIVIPEQDRRFYTEKVVWLPESYQCNDSARPVAQQMLCRTDAGLPDDAFVFCAFNAGYKITPEIFDIWMRLLREVPGSVLWLLQSNASVARNLADDAARRGVARERLVFALPVAQEDHLARQALADLFLDTLPCGAHTTASDALWAGLPVLTCLGDSFAGRVAASLLNAVGLPELVTRSLEDYEATALALARDPAGLAAIRAKLAHNRETHPLFDTQRFTRHLETAYERMAERAKNGRLPEAFAVAAVGSITE